MPEITIIIPHLRQWTQLETCLESLHRQGLDSGHYTIIVVDNGSPDFEDARKRITALYPSITMIAEDRAGPGLARNKGISLAKTGMIACIDADCIADSRWIDTALSALKATGPGTAYGGDIRIAMKDDQKPTPIEAYEAVFGFRQRLYIHQKHFSATANMAFWKSDFEKVGPFGDITIAEDLDWGVRSHRLGLKLSFHPGMIVNHPARPDMAALERKWARHIAHDLEAMRNRKDYALRWPAMAVAVAVSAIPHLWLVLTSNRLSGIKARVKAGATLIRIRLFRAREMVRQMMTPNSEARRWNR